MIFLFLNFTLIFWVIFAKLTSDLDSRSEVSMAPALVKLCFGVMVQNNLSRLYNTAITFFLLGLFRAKLKCVE